MKSARKRRVQDLKQYAEQDDVITLGASIRASSQDPATRLRRSSQVPAFASHNTTTTTVSQPIGNNSRASSFAFGSNRMAECLTREWNKLEPTGQQEVTQDIYGIEIPNAKVNFDDHDFEELQNEINALEEKEEYLLAEEMSPAFVHNPNFRILFLRATLGHSKKAAKRLVRHFKTKLALFGQDKLVQEITLEDLNADDMESLQSGGFQILPRTDRAGRAILFGRYTSFQYKEPINMIRVLWYIWMTLLEDEANQIKGITALGYEIGRSPLERYDHQDGDDNYTFEMSSDHGDGFDRNLAKQITTIPLSVPVRPVGYHLCTDSDQWVATLNMVVATICKFMRLRMRLHHGSDQECKYQLMTHGLPADAIPEIKEDGNVNLTNHLEWIERRRTLEAERQTAAIRNDGGNI